MNLQVNVFDGKTEEAIREIAKLKGCSIEKAAELVLERHAQQAMRMIESAQRAVEIALNEK
ncbi:hypothetical protein [Pseudogracilibacillus auburnensis]|uniref:hypothetical protein n=1 Tax=Pseudogracilibacillus auburnensis TaxID=1494959 RepID=UPI001A968888|nr:hypothetical protein [Pseudogracilibacillus auburnensis]MBO1005767.1 hypothetical protein [Pseudogracilibacillus auburnensis]